jgi:perosamine synthetase
MSWFVFVVRLEEGIDRDRVARLLQNRGIATRAYFAPIHLQPYMRQKFGFREGDFPVAEKVAASTLALPFHGNLKESQMDAVVTELRNALAAH